MAYLPRALQLQQGHAILRCIAQTEDSGEARKGGKGGNKGVVRPHASHCFDASRLQPTCLRLREEEHDGREPLRSPALSIGSSLPMLWRLTLPQMASCLCVEAPAALSMHVDCWKLRGGRHDARPEHPEQFRASRWRAAELAWASGMDVSTQGAEDGAATYNGYDNDDSSHAEDEGRLDRPTMPPAGSEDNDGIRRPTRPTQEHMEAGPAQEDTYEHIEDYDDEGAAFLERRRRSLKGQRQSIQGGP